MSKIQDFYKDQNVFITGGTGFIGKIIVEKLLRACPEIGTIYLLVRPKRGKTIEERLHQIATLPMFEPLRERNPNFQSKIVGINGDAMKPGLGLSDEDRNLLTKEVSIIFHGAATTKFNESLKTSVPINVNSVMEIINICRECKKLKAAVYLSTAFSQCIYDRIEEKVYPGTMTYEKINEVQKFLEETNFSEQDEEKFTNNLLGKFPNTYTLTKSIAEGLLNEKANDLPFCIFRFSIVLASYTEPVLGWVDTIQGFNQGLIGIGLGAIHVINIDRSKKLDFVPADFTCNALIAAVCETGTNKKNRGTDELPVYNYVSSTDNPFTWFDFETHFRKAVHLNPLNKAFYYPDSFLVKSTILFAFFNFFIHFIPSLLGDILLTLLRKKPIFHKIYKQGIKLIDVTRFVTLRDWSFETNRVRSMWNNLSEIDKELIHFDIKSFDWYDVIAVQWVGIKKYLMKDDMSPEGLKRALRRQSILYIVHRTFQLLLIILFIWLTWKLF